MLALQRGRSRVPFQADDEARRAWCKPEVRVSHVRYLGTCNHNRVITCLAESRDE